MFKSHIYYELSLLAVIIASATLYGCNDDLFNEEKVKATYTDKFPVANIDPAMDWKTTATTNNTSITISEDAGTDYAIRIYDANPFFNNTKAKVLATDTINNETSFTSKVTYPNHLTALYVTMTNLKNNISVMKYVDVAAGNLFAHFGNNITTRALKGNQKAMTRTLATPSKSEEEVIALIDKATPIKTEFNQFQSGGIYTIEPNDEYQGKIYSQQEGNLNPNNPAIIIIQGTWAPNVNNMDVETGYEFYIMSGGQISIPDSQTITFKNSTNITIFKGGKIEGSKLYLSNASNGTPNFNYGTIDVQELQSDGQSTFYNFGEAHIGNLNFNSGTKIINYNKLSIDRCNNNAKLENFCQLTMDTWTGDELIMQDNTAATVRLLGNTNKYGMKIIMGNNSMLTATETANLNGANISKNGTEPALIKLHSISGLANFSTSGNIYYEVEVAPNFSNPWEQNFVEALKQGDGTLAQWDEAPVLIPTGDCTGEGHLMPSSGTDLPNEPITYTYAFEDNFPLVGDYDFNDIVLDVNTEYFRESSSKNIKKIQINITLAAVGAGKRLGGALRLVNFPKAAVKKIKSGGDDKRFQRNLENNVFFEGYNPNTLMEDTDPSVVIPLFDFAHRVLLDDEGNTETPRINTAEEGTQDSRNDIKARTYELIIELNKSYWKKDPMITKDNMDFFICYNYKRMDKRMEVHLYEFRDFGATQAGTVQKENLDLAGNNTWAICVPNFRYPKEYINICDKSNNANSAYPQFIDWAVDRNSNQDWYLNPNANNVYR